MTKQELFNKVYDWLTRDFATQCSEINGNCMYIRKDGNRCAIGALLSEETLSVMGDSGQGIEGLLCGAYRDLVRKDLGEELTTGYPAFLSELQNLHDNDNNWSNIEEMRGALIVFAQLHGLTYPDGVSHGN